ncbi:MAG: hypothetical protein H0X41_04355 [Chitinophagaceae bacterium]|nr:hypothetical protein [Chitinophagaceae bacterium]
MKIADIECYVLVAPGLQKKATSSFQDNLAVIVRTDYGRLKKVACAPSENGSISIYFS